MSAFRPHGALALLLNHKHLEASTRALRGIGIAPELLCPVLQLKQLLARILIPTIGK
jgi:hypothetical protein